MAEPIIIDDREVVAALQALQRQVGSLRPVLLSIGEELLQSTKQRFETKEGPDGEDWAANSETTIARKGFDDPLIDTHSLMTQIHYTANADTLELAPSMKYAAMQQFGGTAEEFPWLWGDIPARPFMGFSAADKADVLDVIEEHLRKAL